MLTITGLHIYPIKSCGGIALTQAALDERGLRYDRQWMIVQDDEEERGLFLTQRELPELALIQSLIDDGALAITAPRMAELKIPLAEPADARTLPVVVWRDQCIGLDEGDEAAEWVSRYLGLAARLVRMPEAFVRPVNPAYAVEPARTGFSDGYPILLASEESLADLNVRLNARGKADVPMSRFRPNIVVKGGTPYEEDRWKTLTHNGLHFEVVKPCARCAITTVDQKSGTIPDREEPLATLSTYRRGERGVMFGQNVIHRGLGTLHIGDTLQVAASG